MKRVLPGLAILLLVANFTIGQVIIVPIGLSATIGAAIMPEHGFLGGKKFAFYPTIEKYDFNGLTLRVELMDDRPNLKLTKVQCSEIPFTNTSEFADPACIYKVKEYLDTLFRQAGAKIDSTASDTLRVKLEGIDARLIGFGQIRAHGLCQMTFSYHNFTKQYCIDITDADKHSPIGKNAFVTRKTATRVIASAAIREVIEQFFVDLAAMRKGS